jgi:hypothetical protein
MSLVGICVVSWLCQMVINRPLENFPTDFAIKKYRQEGYVLKAMVPSNSIYHLC